MQKFTRFLYLILMIALTFTITNPVMASGESKFYPTFSILSVSRDSSVTIITNNLPAYDYFDVLMNYMGTRGIGGYLVTSIYSGSGGSQTFTFNIPAALFGQYQIAIRLQSRTGSGYYAYNWFYNNTAGGGQGGRGPVYNFPTFWISAVTRDNTVTVVANNLPAHDTFQLLMGPMGTRGINGYWVTNFDTGSGGTQTLTFSIPAALYGSHRISIRMESITGSGYFAYNWFYNNTTH